MAKSKLVQSPNRILAQLSTRAYAELLPRMQAVELVYGQMLYEPAVVIHHVYFPLDCVVSLLASVDRKRSTEVGMVGCEGMLGNPLILGVKTSTVLALVQGSGSALSLTTARFRAEIKAKPMLQTALMHYTHGLMSQIAQTAACNRFHTTEARLARWLLMMADRLRSNSFYLTQEFLAQMLGVRREGVTGVAGKMEKQGVIRYSRGRILIRDRRRLENLACDCYKIVNTIQAARINS